MKSVLWRATEQPGRSRPHPDADFCSPVNPRPQRNPMGSPDDLSYLQVRCAKQGEALWHQFTVREVFGEEGVSALRRFTL